VNGWFTLNPSHNPEWKDFTPLEWVAKRQPKRLMVQIGHNHGLFQFGFEAQYEGDPATGFTQKGTSPDQQPPDDYWTQWEKVASGLAALPAGVGTILVVLLPKVGAVASLEPGSDKRTAGYADFYEPAFIPTANVLGHDQVKTADETIRDFINPKIRKIITDAASAAGNAGRLKFLDAWAMFDGYDYKNSLQASRRIRINTNQYIDNRYLDGSGRGFLSWLPGSQLVQGGFQSVDGMHPTGAGYAVLASKALDLLGLKYDMGALLGTAFGRDQLLSNFPVQLDYLDSALHLIRDAARADHFIPDFQKPLTENSHVVEVLHAMTAVFHP
jgi:hypothetical protein